MRDKKAILLILLVSTAIIIEGMAFFFKPKITMKYGDGSPLVKAESELVQPSL